MSTVLKYGTIIAIGITLSFGAILTVLAIVSDSSQIGALLNVVTLWGVFWLLLLKFAELTRDDLR